MRLGAGDRPLFDNVLYEGNNMAMRGALDGAEAARRWQRAAAVRSPIFVLRDALFGQPDNPVEQRGSRSRALANRAGARAA